jgi:hypothetical protein
MPAQRTRASTVADMQVYQETVASLPAARLVGNKHFIDVWKVWREVRVFITAGPSTKLLAWGGGDMGGHVLRETTIRGLCGLRCPSRTGTREEPGTLTQGGALFTLVPLVWESNPKLQGGWCKPKHPQKIMFSICLD